MNNRRGSVALARKPIAEPRRHARHWKWRLSCGDCGEVEQVGQELNADRLTPRLIDHLSACENFPSRLQPVGAGVSLTTKLDQLNMNKIATTLTAAAFMATLSSTYAGDITGKISLKGTPPASPAVTVSDPNCGKTGKELPKSMPWYVVGKDGGLADVFVYLKEGVTSKPAASGTPVVLDQIGCVYTPYVVGCQTGQKILVKNSDKTLHNVHTTPTAAGNKEINKAQLPGGADLEFIYNTPEVFLRFKCDVHPWMFSYVGLVDHPYFAVTDANGNFTIKNVPPGKYTIEAVHRKSHPTGKGISSEIKVDGSGAKQDFVIEVK